MPEFSNTAIVRMFLERTMPELVQQLKYLNGHLHKITSEKRCPHDGTFLTLIGEAAIMDVDGRWNAETTRYKCSMGHIIFMGDSNRLEDTEIER